MKAPTQFAVAIAVLGLSTFPAAALGQSVAERCPGYAGQLERARDSLIRQDRTGAVAALREAEAVLAECLRRESDEAGERTPLSASPVPQLRYS